MGDIRVKEVRRFPDCLLIEVATQDKQNKHGLTGEYKIGWLFLNRKDARKFAYELLMNAEELDS